MSDISVQDITIEEADDENGVVVTGRGGVRIVSYEELRQMVDTDHPVEVR